MVLNFYICFWKCRFGGGGGGILVKDVFGNDVVVVEWFKIYGFGDWILI